PFSGVSVRPIRPREGFTLPVRRAWRRNNRRPIHTPARRARERGAVEPAATDQGIHVHILAHAVVGLIVLEHQQSARWPPNGATARVFKIGVPGIVTSHIRTEPPLSLAPFRRQAINACTALETERPG